MKKKLIILIFLSCVLSSCRVFRRTPETPPAPEREPSSGIIFLPVPEKLRIKTQHFHKNQSPWVTFTDRHFVALSSNGYVIMRNEPNDSAEIMTTIPNNTFLPEVRGQMDEWRVMRFHNIAERTVYHGFVHESQLVRVPQNVSGQLGWEITRHEPPHFPIMVSRALTLKPIEQEEDFIFRVFFFNDMRHGFWLRTANGEQHSGPLTTAGGNIFAKENYQWAGYDFGENPPVIKRYHYLDNWNRSAFSFNEIHPYVTVDFSGLEVWERPTTFIIDEYAEQKTETIISQPVFRENNVRGNTDPPIRFEIKEDIIIRPKARDNSRLFPQN